MVNSYTEALQYLYSQLPVYHLVGAAAYKKDLTNTLALCSFLQNPEKHFRTIHVAGTNGKGSSSHMLAAILQCAGYNTGLYTSPHLKNFGERIKISGHEIDQGFVVDFVNRMQGVMHDIQPSFFELTVAMAFQYFAQEKIDIAVVEVGLGGRLDSTNVISPEVSLITNIGYDHMDILGNSLPEIAFEKAGIIKPKTPVVISERQVEVEHVFIEKAKAESSDILFASDVIRTNWNGPNLEVESPELKEVLNPELKGRYQAQNIAGVVATALRMRKLGWKISDQAIVSGINQCVSLTGLKGRWQIIGKQPLVVCDTGHNAEGIQELIDQISVTPHQNLRWVFGLVKDKSIERILSILPKDGQYYFCQAKIERALDAETLLKKANEYGLHGLAIADVNQALDAAIRESNSNDLVMVGGSTFVVAEVKNL